MNIHFLFLLLVFKATKCDKIAESRTMILPKIDEKCKNMKCSAEEDPTCVKIKHLRDIKKVFHVIAVNKCELQFMKCHKDYEANIVAMKLCDHENILKKKEERNASMTHRVRVKRSIFRSVDATRGHDAFDAMSSEDEPGHKIHSSDIYYDADYTNKHPILVDPNQHKNKRPLSRHQDFKRKKDQNRHRNILPLSHHQDSKNKKVSDEQLPMTAEDEAGFRINVDDIYYDDILTTDNDDHRTRLQKLKKKIKELRRKRNLLKAKAKQEKETKLKLTKEDKKNSELKLVLGNIEKKIEGLKLAASEEEKDKFSGEPLAEEISPDEFQLFSAENIGERNNNADNAVPVNDEECPDSCPAHADMICVKFVYGIYKTFLSSCHLRRYCCKKNTGGNRRQQVYKAPPIDLCKDMQLVSRHGCILSAPYIDRPGEASQGKVEDQHNNDDVVDYFKCKFLEILGKSDPRCPY